jgi:REP element-mobilizing transposase RayT
MIIAYHAIFTTYGTWLPNDPRGSFSKDVYVRNLKAIGTVKYGRQNPQPSGGSLYKFWVTAKHKTATPPFFINDKSRPLVADGFRKVISRLKIVVPACVIMNDHVHIIIYHSKYRIEYLVNQLKGSATKELNIKGPVWTRGCWKVFINDEETLNAAVEYIRANPVDSNLPSKSWDFVTPV